MIDELAKFIKILEDKFVIKDIDNFEDDILDVIKSSENTVLDIEEIEKAFFETIGKYTSLDFTEVSQNVKKELVYIQNIGGLYGDRN